MNTPTTNDTYTCSWATTGPKTKPSERNLLFMTLEEIMKYLNQKPKTNDDEEA